MSLSNPNILVNLTWSSGLATYQLSNSRAFYSVYIIYHLIHVMADEFYVLSVGHRTNIITNLQHIHHNICNVHKVLKMS